MKRTFNPNSDLTSTIYQGLINKAFTELQAYTGWPDDYIQTLLDNYPEGDNFYCLSNYINDIINHKGEPKPHTFEFYINTDDILMLDAYAITGDPEIDQDPNFFIYDPKNPNLNDYRVTIYEDPLTKVQFNFFID